MRLPLSFSNITSHADLTSALVVSLEQKWAHWLSNPLSPSRSEDAVTPLQVYPWQDLSSSSFKTTFHTKGLEVYPRTMLRFSIAGMLANTE